jgi:NADH-quinone oxidoreductase subunit N
MVSNMALFVVIIVWVHMNDSEEIADFKGMRDRAPVLAGVLAGALFSLAGLPLFAGFFTKFILFQAATNEGYLWLAAIGVTTSVISLYYYLQVMREVFVSPADEGAGRLNVPYLMQGLAVALMLAVLYVGIYPTHLFELADNAATFLFV